jgi:hypothetical protein
VKRLYKLNKVLHIFKEEMVEATAT